MVVIDYAPGICFLVIRMKKEKQLNQLPEHSIIQNTVCLQIKMEIFYESRAVSCDTRQGSFKKITLKHYTGARGRVSCAVNITNM